METRPADLPDYSSPPLNEVVLGVQFAQPEGYQQIRAGDVWGLYKSQYPTVEEQPALNPQFETFGGRPSNVMKFGIMTGATHDRFWFVSAAKDELIQFQADRLLHNWRKIGEGDNPYPRFEKMIEKFERELIELEKYLGTLGPQSLAINQCEVSYINHIVIGETRDPAAWLSFLNLSPECQADDISVTIRRALKNADGKFGGRLIIEANSGLTPKDVEILVLTLTVRGAPQGKLISDAIRFISSGRQTIVKTFSKITTESAQKLWDRIQ